MSERTPPKLAPHSTSAVERSNILAGISETLSRYCYAVDEKNREILLDTFTSDAVVVAEVAHGKPIPRLEGVAIVDFIISHRADIRRHFLTNLWIEEIAGDVVSVRSYHLIVVSDAGKSETRCTGTYRDEMVLSDDGIWRSRFKEVKLDAPY